MSFVVRLSCKLSFPASSLAVRSAIVPSVSNGWPSVRHFAAKKTADKDEKEKKGGKGKGDGSAKEKKGGGTSKKFRPPGEGQGEIDAIYKFLHACEDAKNLKLEHTPEEIARRAPIIKEYQRQCNNYHNKTREDLANKIWLQQDALRAMPEELRAHALILDETPPPMDRPWPKFDTPPIKGFNPQDYVDKKREKEVERDDDLLMEMDQK